MEREKPNFDILGRIDRERLARGWSEYNPCRELWPDAINLINMAQKKSSAQRDLD